MNEKSNEITDTAYKKLAELLNCGNERVELAAAKELMGFNEKSDDSDIKLDVTIKVVQG